MSPILVKKEKEDDVCVQAIVGRRFLSLQKEVEKKVLGSKESSFSCSQISEKQEKDANELVFGSI